MAVQISGTVGKRQTGQSDNNKTSLLLDAVRNFLLLFGALACLQPGAGNSWR